MALKVAGSRIVSGFSTTIDKAHLGAHFMREPASLGMLVDQLYANKTMEAYPLYSYLLSQNKVENTIESWPDFTYKVPTAQKRPIVIIRDIMPDGTKHGYGQNKFEILTDENYLVPSDEISPGNIDIQVRVDSHGQRTPAGWKYTVSPKHNLKASYIDKKYFTPGTKWIKLWASGEEGNQQKGSTMFYPNGLKINAHGGKLNKHYKMTDYAMMNRVPGHIQIALKNGAGKMGMSVMTFAEDAAYKEWYNEINRACWFQKSGEVYGSTNRQIDYFTGAYHQVKDNGWQMGYTRLSSKMILEFFKKIHMGRTIRKEKKHLKLFAGEAALNAFSESLFSDITKLGFALLSENFVRKFSSDVHPNALEYGGQFAAWRLPNGTLVELIHEPAFDDNELHFERDPLTGYSKMSGTMICMDVSGMGMTSNVRLVNPTNNSNYVTYKIGNVDWKAFGQGNIVSDSEDALSINFTRNMAIVLDDPTSTGILFRQ